MIHHRIRLRIQITRLDPIQPRLWQLVRHDLGAQLRGFFQYEPEIGMDQGDLTTYMIAVTPDTARVGLNAPAFALAIRKMVNEYGLPQRFGVGVAIVRLPEAFSHDQKRQLTHSMDLAPTFEWLEIVETAEGK
jgi:hypothetical protein